MPATTDQDLTVEQLAQRCDMTVRNIREYQRLGLLAPPERRGRVGFYEAAHVERIERIRELRASGFPLDLVKKILDGDDPDVTAFAHTVTAPFQDEEPELTTREAYQARFRVLDESAIDEAVELGLLRIRDDGLFEIVSPRLAQVGDAMVSMGLSLTEMLALQRDVLAHQEAIATRFLELFRERVWEPFEAAGAPPDGLPLVHQLLELVRPRALDTVTVAFQMAMDAAVKDLLEEME